MTLIDQHTAILEAIVIQRRSTSRQQALGRSAAGKRQSDSRVILGTSIPIAIAFRYRDQPLNVAGRRGSVGGSKGSADFLKELSQAHGCNDQKFDRSLRDVAPRMPNSVTNIQHVPGAKGMPLIGNEDLDCSHCDAGNVPDPDKAVKADNDNAGIDDAGN